MNGTKHIGTIACPRFPKIESQKTIVCATETDGRTCQYCHGNNPFGYQTHIGMPDGTQRAYCNTCTGRNDAEKSAMRDAINSTKS